MHAVAGQRSGDLLGKELTFPSVFRLMALPLYFAPCTLILYVRFLP